GVLHVARDAGVAADAELAEPARALVGVEHLEQEVLVGVGARVDDPAALEAQADRRQLAPRIHGRELAEDDLALGAVLDRAVEDLAAGDVRACSVDLSLAARQADSQIRALAENPDLVRGVEELLDPRHALALGVPVQEHGSVEELRELWQGHA